MTLDNDRNPIAPHHPSDPPPRRQGLDAGGAQTEAEGVAAPPAPPTPRPSQDIEAGREAATAADDATHRRAIVAALLSTLPAMLLPLVLFSLRLWCRAIGAAIEACTAPPSTGDQANGAGDAHQRKARRELGAALVRASADALYDTAPAGPAGRVCELLSVVWFCALPGDVDAALCRGLAAEALADLDAFEAGAAPASTPRIVRITAREPCAGRAFTSADLDALTRDAAALLCAVRASAATDEAAELVTFASNATLAALAGDGAPAHALTYMGSAFAAVGETDAAYAEGETDPQLCAERATRTAALFSLAARAFGAAAVVCAEAVGRGVQNTKETRWPAASAAA